MIFEYTYKIIYVVYNLGLNGNKIFGAWKFAKLPYFPFCIIISLHFMYLPALLNINLRLSEGKSLLLLRKF